MLVKYTVDWNGNVLDTKVINNKKLDNTNLVRFYADKFKRMVIEDELEPLDKEKVRV